VVVTTADYEQRLRDHYVILSAAERRTMIQAGLDGAKPDPALLETLVYLTEYPAPLAGSFDASYLELPAEVLVTVMRHHQKYFSVEDVNGNLEPRFIAVMNIPSDPEGFVRRGNERVLRRDSTMRASSGTRSEEEAGGSQGRSRARDVSGQARVVSRKDRAHDEAGRGMGGGAAAARGAELSKIDLTTELVKEFTELQGVVGGLYARVQGEPDEVWQSIYDHYKPESMEDSIPRHRTAQIVALADKVDTLRGCFRVGLIPSGSRDPFALRRAAQAWSGSGGGQARDFAAGSDRRRSRVAVVLRGSREILFPRRARIRV
jgi:glycyl-tRNA synthetase beta chain